MKTKEEIENEIKRLEEVYFRLIDDSKYNQADILSSEIRGLKWVLHHSAPTVKRDENV